jgi:SDR family mycofactocin-dependent oxidoreductase
MSGYGRLVGRVALVTGAGRGQGRSHCVALAREGCDVVACDLDEQIDSVEYPLSTAEDLAETVRLVEEQDRRCIGMTTDIRHSDQVDAAVARAVEEFGKLDIAVANAGIVSYKTVLDMDDQTFRDAIDVMATGTFFTIRAAARAMVPNRSGRIICTSSTVGRQGMPLLSHYAAAKWGVIGMMKTAALELAEHNITVNCVCPGATGTPMIQNEATAKLFRPDLENPTIEDMEEVIRRDLHKLPVTWIEPNDISNAVCFLASDDARYVSGVGLDVNTGLSGAWTA